MPTKSSVGVDQSNIMDMLGSLQDRMRNNNVMKCENDGYIGRDWELSMEQSKI